MSHISTYRLPTAFPSTLAHLVRTRYLGMSRSILWRFWPACQSSRKHTKTLDSSPQDLISGHLVQKQADKADQVARHQRRASVHAARSSSSKPDWSMSAFSNEVLHTVAVGPRHSLHGAEMQPGVVDYLDTCHQSTIVFLLTVCTCRITPTRCMYSYCQTVLCNTAGSRLLRNVSRLAELADRSCIKGPHFARQAGKKACMCIVVSRAASKLISGSRPLRVVVIVNSSTI